MSQPPSDAPPAGGVAVISPLSARQFAVPSGRQPVSADPPKEKSGMKSWVAAKMVSRKRGTAARVERKVFVDMLLLSSGAKFGQTALSRKPVAQCESLIALCADHKDYHTGPRSAGDSAPAGRVI